MWSWAFLVLSEWLVLHHPLHSHWGKRTHCWTYSLDPITCAGQKKLTEKSLFEDLVVHKASARFKLLCCSCMLRSRGNPSRLRGPSNSHFYGLSAIFTLFVFSSLTAVPSEKLMHIVRCIWVASVSCLNEVHAVVFSQHWFFQLHYDNYLVVITLVIFC